MKRVLYVIGSLDVGGTEQHLVQIAKQLKERGWSPEVFVFKPEGPLAPLLKEVGIPIHTSTAPSWLPRLLPISSIYARISLIALLLGLIRLMLHTRPPIVHFFLPGAYLVGGLAALFTRTRPRLMSRRSMNNYQTAYPVHARLERFLHSRMDMLCGNSMAVLEQLAAEGAPKEKLRLIYNGVDLERYRCLTNRQLVRASLSVDDSSFVVTVVANLKPYKGHLDLLMALSKIASRLPQPWLCMCVGRDDGIGKELACRAEEYGISRNLKLLGSRSDVPELLQASDLGVLCSHEEGFSNAVIEAMAAGLPMVVTDVGGNAEAVVDGLTGRVVPARNPNLLGDAILELALDPFLRQEMGAKGRSRAQSHFDMAACVSAYEALYDEFRGE